MKRFFVASYCSFASNRMFKRKINSRLADWKVAIKLSMIRILLCILVHGAFNRPI